MMERNTLDENRETMNDASFANARHRSTNHRSKHGVTEKQFGISTDNYQQRAATDDVAKKKGPIDEVQALRAIFYTFFKANSMDKSQKDVLVSMTTHETSINPFIVPETNFTKVDN